MEKTARFRRAVVAAAGRPLFVTETACSAFRTVSASPSAGIGTEARSIQASAATISAGAFRSRPVGVNAQPNKARRNTASSGRFRAFVVSTAVIAVSASAIDRRE
nr:hypothetical protein [Micromonospora sp. DSM 115978]